MKRFESVLKNLPKNPGVYIYKDRTGKVLYVGKAVNLKHRVKSYFKGDDNRPQIPKLISQVKKIETKKTDSEIEALLLEADLINHFDPPFNIRFRDDKSYSYIFINFADEIPIVKLVRKKQIDDGSLKIRKKDKLFGPFTNSLQVKIALRELRKIFPWHDSSRLPPDFYRGVARTINVRACQHHQIGLCPGICAGKIRKSDYRKIVRQLCSVLSGGKKEILRQMKTEMKKYADAKNYESAADLRDKIKGLEHIGNVSLVRKKDEQNMLNITGRIEGYDVANISGKMAVGVMIVYSSSPDEYRDEKSKKFYSSRPSASNNKKFRFDKSEYRMFKIRTIKGINDVGMIREIVKRRFRHKEWKKPSLIIVDGGPCQVGGVQNQIQNLSRAKLRDTEYKIPIIAIAKGPNRKREKLYFGDSQFEFRYLPEWARRNTNLIKKIRDEAHRFAQSYFHKLQIKAKGDSDLLKIPGVGEKTYKKLLNHFGDTKKIKNAGQNELFKVIGRKKTEMIKRIL